MDGGLPYDHSSSLRWQGEGVGSEIEKCHIHRLFPALLWPMQSFTAGHREAKTLAVFKEGFPGRGTSRNIQCLRKTHIVLSVLDGTLLKNNHPLEPARGGQIKLHCWILPGPE